jgi:hypothetical protein
MGALFSSPKAPAAPPPPPNVPTMASSDVAQNIAGSQQRMRQAAGAGFSGTVKNSGGEAGMTGAPITTKPLLGS